MRFKDAEKKIKELASAMKDTDIQEIEYASGSNNILVVRMPDNKEETAAAEPGKEQARGPEESGEKKKVTVYSHSVGIYRDVVPPSRKASVRSGQKVDKGEVLGAVESMKIMKEILAPVSGRIAVKLIKNNDSVQYGQELFEIEESV